MLHMKAWNRAGQNADKQRKHSEGFHHQSQTEKTSFDDHWEFTNLQEQVQDRSRIVQIVLNPTTVANNALTMESPQETFIKNLLCEDSRPPFSHKPLFEYVSLKKWHKLSAIKTVAAKRCHRDLNPARHVLGPGPVR